MFSQKLLDAMNEQMKNEFLSGYLYLAMAGYFEAEDLPVMFNTPDLNVTRWGTLRVDHKTQMTNLDGVFAVGDIVRGASLVVWAIRDGREAAQAILAYLAQGAQLAAE